jgi:signal peptidase II
LGEPLKYHIFIPALIVVAVAGLDQISKNLIVRTLAEGENIPIIEGLFNLTLNYNRGAAFGFLANIENSTIRVSLLWGATILALCAVAFMFIFEYRGNSKGQIALSLILGGALGNIIDRFSLGEVIDFLDVYYRNHHWPAFNLADSAICIGVSLLLLPKLNFFPKNVHPNSDSDKKSSEEPQSSLDKLPSKEKEDVPIAIEQSTNPKEVEAAEELSCNNLGNDSVGNAQNC